MRAFVALELPSPLKAKVAAFQERLRREWTGINWVDSAQFHVTLSFLGEVELKDTSRLLEAVRELAMGREVLRLSLGGVGFFPVRQRARVVFLDFREGQDELAGLLQACRQWMAKGGFHPAGGNPHPHLTLGRCRREEDFGMDNLPAFNSNYFLVREICLYESILTPTGPLYRPLGRSSLSG